MQIQSKRKFKLKAGALLALFTSLSTRWSHLHSHIAYDCPIIDSVTSVKSAKGVSLSQLETPGIPGSDKKPLPASGSLLAHLHYNYLQS